MTAALELESVSVTIDGRRILKGIDWRLAAASQAAMLGPNGCGKSTLLRTICGYRFPSEGRVHVLGSQLGKVDLDALRRRIGLVDPSGPFTPDGRLTVLEVVLSGYFGHLCLDFDHPSPGQIERADKAAHDVGLGTLLSQRFDTLSTGEQRRALLARALVAEPELLILDEPTAGLDLLARETLLATIDRVVRTNPALTVLTVTHHLEELPARLDEVLLLRSGSVVARGDPPSVLTAGNLSQAFGCPVAVHRDHGRWGWSVSPAVWSSLIDSAGK